MSILNSFKWFGILLPVLHVLFLFSSDYRSHYSGVFGVLGWIAAELFFLSFYLILSHLFCSREEIKMSCLQKTFCVKADQSRSDF